MGVSSTQYLPETDHVLFCPGVGTPTVNGLGGRVIEVDYKTKEVISEIHFQYLTIWHFTVPNEFHFIRRTYNINIYEAEKLEK